MVASARSARTGRPALRASTAATGAGSARRSARRVRAVTSMPDRGRPCAAGEFCDYPDDAFCGAADGTGVCLPRPEVCDTVFDPVCGCDGASYSNECQAHAAGTDVAMHGECGTTPDPCAPQTARGEGMCDAFFGYYWDGAMCYGVSGCSCMGTDCGSGWDSPEACMDAHSGCPGGGGGG